MKWTTFKYLVWRFLKRFSQIHSEKDGTPSWIRWIPSIILAAILSGYLYGKVKDIHHDFGPNEVIVIGICIGGKVLAKAKGMGEATAGEIEENEDAPTDGKNSQDS